MLAMKSVFGDGEKTAVFDEIDAGVSGGTSYKVGRKLHALAAGTGRAASVRNPLRAACRAGRHALPHRKASRGQPHRNARDPAGRVRPRKGAGAHPRRRIDHRGRRPRRKGAAQKLKRRKVPRSGLKNAEPAVAALCRSAAPPTAPLYGAPLRESRRAAVAVGRSRLSEGPARRMRAACHTNPNAPHSLTGLPVRRNPEPARSLTSRFGAVRQPAGFCARSVSVRFSLSAFSGRDPHAVLRPKSAPCPAQITVPCSAGGKPPEMR